MCFSTATHNKHLCLNGTSCLLGVTSVLGLQSYGSHFTQLSQTSLTAGHQYIWNVFTMLHLSHALFLNGLIHICHLQNGMLFSDSQRDYQMKCLDNLLKGETAYILGRRVISVTFSGAMLPQLSYDGVDYVILPFFVIPFEFEKPTSKGFSVVKHILMPFLKQGKKEG